MSNQFSIPAGVFVALAVCGAAPAQAQEGAPADDVIVVTAQRRAENIQDVPITMTALSGQAIETGNVQTLSDVARLTPGLNFSEANDNVFPFIRGVGSLLQSSSTANSVSIYLDDIYLSRLSGLSLDMGNVDQVQILKGPQATLFGRNATGGAIVVTTRTSYGGDPIGGHVEGTYGSYDLRRFVGSVGGGLTDTIGFDLTASYARREGSVENLATNLVSDDNDLESLDQVQVNAKLSYRPNDDARVVASLFHGSYDDTLGYGARQAFPVQAGGLLSAFFGAGAAGDTFSTTPQETYQQYGQRSGWYWLGSLTGDFSTTIGDLRTITAYRRDRASSDTNVTHDSFGLFGAQTESPSEMFSQEIRLTSNSDGPFSWIVGATVLDEGSNPGRFAGGAVLQRAGGTLLPPQTVVEWDRFAWSTYADATYELTDRLRVRGGLRYSHEESDAVTVESSIGLAGISQESSDNDLAWRAVVDYRTAAGLVYVSAAKGFKAGGINTYNTASPAFDPESVLSYEVGFKSERFADMFTFNTALFTYDFRDVQLQRIGGATGIETFYSNGDSATLSGFDVELAADLTSALSVQAGATYLWEREYDDVNIPATLILPPLFASGNDIAGAPELSAILGINYDIGFSSGGGLLLAANYEYNSGYFFDAQNLVGTGGTSAESYGLLSLRGTYTFPSENVTLSLYGTNVLDEEYIHAGYPVFNGAVASIFDGRPAEYGVTLGYRF